MNGLPAHVLLVHAVVVLVPLTSLLLVLVTVWPAARARLTVFTAVVAVITLVAVPITTEAGEWLEHRLPHSELIEVHAELGDTMLPWAIGLAVVALAVAGRERAARRTRRHGPGTVTAPRTRPGGAAVTVVIAVLAVVLAVGALVTVYRIGDSGAVASWTGKFSPTPISGPGSPGFRGGPPGGTGG
ncbi:hypothetical protein Acsp06_51440 [Actinomycetospora sp. NBRC 106375]|nr:hypothetical protein Acsp06_51440 [Actinomycetospora sp. NBRC 106375]